MNSISYGAVLRNALALTCLCNRYKTNLYRAAKNEDSKVKGREAVGGSSELIKAK